MVDTSWRDGEEHPAGPAGGMLEWARLIFPISIWSTVLLATAIALATMLTLYASSRASLDYRLDAARQNVSMAFATGALSNDSYAYGNSIVGDHQFNDCLIIGMSLNQPPHRDRRLTISPIVMGVARSLDQRIDYDAPCLALHRLVDGQTDTSSEFYYHRYLHGQVILTRFLLPHLEVSSIRDLYKNGLSGLLLLGLAVSLIRLSLERSSLAVGLVIVFVCFARFYGLGEFGQSLGHGPSDTMCVLYLVFLSVVAGRPAAASSIPIAAAFFGALTMVFELLTGGLPLGAAIVIGTSALACSPGLPLRKLAEVTARAVVAFGVAALVCVVAKLAAAAVVFGPDVLGDYVGQLGMRMALTTVDGVPNGLSLFVAKAVGGLSSLAEYSRLLAGGVILIAVCSGAWGLRVILRSGRSQEDRFRAGLLAVSALVVLMWFPLFRQHTIQHAWFMDRILVWVIVVGGWLYAMALIDPRPRIASTSDRTLVRARSGRYEEIAEPARDG